MGKPCKFFVQSYAQLGELRARPDLQITHMRLMDETTLLVTAKSIKEKVRPHTKGCLFISAIVTGHRYYNYT